MSQICPTYIQSNQSGIGCGMSKGRYTSQKNKHTHRRPAGVWRSYAHKENRESN